MMLLMKIERLQVEEGFLDGLDITFASGLNVIIGARGVGKTSVLELIRYALRLEHVDSRRTSTAAQHAEAILRGGRVIITFIDAGVRTTVTRAATDPAGIGSVLASSSEAPIILGQNELEGIGLDQRSRLRLIDTYASVEQADMSPDVGRLVASVESLTLQLRDLNVQQEALNQLELVRKKVVDELVAARAVEADLLDRADSNAAVLRERLGEENAKISDLRRELRSIAFARSTFEELADLSRVFEEKVEAAIADLGITASDAVEARYKSAFDRIAMLQMSVSSEVISIIHRLREEMTHTEIQIAEIDSVVRPLRREFEEFEVGASAAAQDTARLEQQLIDIDVNLEKSHALAERASVLRRERDRLMASIDEIRETIWSRRKITVDELNRLFNPRIKLHLEHYGNRGEYVGALASALRGSGLQHNQLAEWLSERMSPQELVSAVEAGDSGHLAVIGELTSARVEKLVNHLAMSDALGRVLTAQVDDLVKFDLLVGRDYRSSEHLSTGQRCAVVLPLLLADQKRVLLLDQPEDHLDNAYLVDNTIQTLVARSGLAQSIVATHNANIPVLGDAALVVCLESDGRRGYVRHIGPVMSNPIVERISELMEGGREAFTKRAEFYRNRT